MKTTPTRRGHRTAALLLITGLLAPAASAALVAVDFGSNEQTGPTAAYTSAQIPEAVTAGGWTNFSGDWSGNGLTLPAGSVSLSAYWDSSNTFANANVAADSPFRGYLDDGAYNGSSALTSWAVQISGLSAWLAANNSTQWSLVVLRATDNAPNGFRDISIHTGSVTQLVSTGVVSDPSATWLSDPVSGSVVDNWPAGGVAATITNGTFVNTGGDSGYAETLVFTGDSDAFILRDTDLGSSGGSRGSIAGLILYTPTSIPEPSTALLGGIALAGLAVRRRRR
jgi:hypothetical protein